VSVKRKRPTSSASKKARGGRTKAAASRASTPKKTKAAKPRSKKPAAKKAAARKVAKAKTAVRKTAPRKAPVKTKAKAAKTAKAVRKTAAPKPAKRAGKAARKTARAANPAAAAHPTPTNDLHADTDIAGFAPAHAEAPLHGQADQPFAGFTTQASAAPATPAPKSAAAPQAKPASDGTDGHDTPRANKLVPTNAVHTTKRRTKSGFWQSPLFAGAAAIGVLALLVIGYRPEPPEEVTPLEQRADASPATDAPTDIATPHLTDPMQAAPDRPWSTAATHGAQPAHPSSGEMQTSAPQVATASAEATRETTETTSRPTASMSAWDGLETRDLIEMERMLARLDLGPGPADGIVDRKTESAIRMYQQIAGLPIDGKPSAELLEDMRAVVKMLSGG
jgi:hypothetical protein